MQPYMLRGTPSSSPGQQVFSPAWRLDEEWDEGRPLAATPPVYVNMAPHSQEHLSSCPNRQQRRQSWGPAVFSPSPLSTSPLHAMSHIRCMDLLSPCAPGHQRRQCLGPTVISSPQDARCVKVSCHYCSTPDFQFKLSLTFFAVYIKDVSLLHKKKNKYGTFRSHAKLASQVLTSPLLRACYPRTIR